MVMTCAMGDAVLRDRLPTLWRLIEDAHYSYLETDDSPEKLEQKKKLEDYIIEYLSLVPHECKFGLSETGKVFQRTINELPDFSAYRAGLGWAALARYAANLLAQPWRKEYRVIRLYCGYFKHEVEANMVGAEILLQAMGYRPAGAGRLQLDQPICPDMVAAVSRDALIAQCECQIMCQIWEAVWGGGGRATWRDVAATRALQHGGKPAGYCDGSEIYSNIPMAIPPDAYRARAMPPMPCHLPPDLPQCSALPLAPPYAIPYYYPVQAPYLIPTPVYTPIKHATTIPVNGYPPIAQYRYPAVPIAQLIELDPPSVYENGKFERYNDDRSYRRPRHAEPSRRNSTSKSGLISSSDVSLPSLPRSDTQPALSKAKEDGMGTYESWDYVFRNLSSKDRDDSRSRFSPSLDRDSRTLDRLDREERRVKYQPTTLDLEDGLQALNLDRSYDDEVYRTAKVNENLMRIKHERDQKTAKQLAKKQEEKRVKKPLPEIIGHPKAEGLIPSKVAQDKIKLLSKKDIKDRKDIIKQQNGVASVSSAAEVRKVKKPAKLVAVEVDKPRKAMENGHSIAHCSKTSSNPATNAQPSYDLKAQLVVSLDETDHRPSKSTQNGDRDRSVSRTSSLHTETKNDKWECTTCTYLNKGNLQACEMCGKSKRGPEIQPLRSGGRECPACTLVNERDATVCDACGTSLQHCPTYI